MGVKNYLIEGVSCAGKTTVGSELLGRSKKLGSPRMAALTAILLGYGTLRRSEHWWPINSMRKHSFAAVPGITIVLSICSMKFLFLTSIWIR